MRANRLHRVTFYPVPIRRLLCKFHNETRLEKPRRSRALTFSDFCAFYRSTRSTHEARRDRIGLSVLSMGINVFHAVVISARSEIFRYKSEEKGERSGGEVYRRLRLATLNLSRTRQLTAIRSGALLFFLSACSAAGNEVPLESPGKSMHIICIDYPHIRRDRASADRILRLDVTRCYSYARGRRAESKRTSTAVREEE